MKAATKARPSRKRAVAKERAATPATPSQPAFLNFNYGGSVGDRLSTPWPMTQYTPEYRYLSYQELMRMRDRARHLERNNSIADGLLSRSVENVVGPVGFQLQARTLDKKWNKQARELWDEECDSLDVTGLTWLEHQRLVFRSHLRDGDVASILLNTGQIQPIEGDLICNPNTGPKGKNSMVDGIEINPQGTPVRFNIASYDAAGKQQAKPYDAKDIVFYPRLKRIGQVRGEPCFAQNFKLFDQIDKWVEAVLAVLRMAACSGYAVTKNQPGKFGRGLKQTTNNGGQKTRQLPMQPGMVPVLEEGESIEVINATQPGPGFPAILTTLLRLTGLTLGMPLELVLLDFSQGSYATVRAALLQAYQAWRTMQRIFIGRYISRIYKWKVSRWMNDGLLAQRDDAWKHRFMGQPWPYLDPLKELTAIQLGIDIGIDNLTSALQSQNHDVDTMLDTRRDELKKMRKGKIPIVHAQQVMPYEPGNFGGGDGDDETDEAI
jgi:lambda family phage portal protein